MPKGEEMFNQEDVVRMENPETPNDVLHSYAETFRSKVLPEGTLDVNQLENKTSDQIKKLISNPNISEDTLQHLYDTVAPSNFSGSQDDNPNNAGRLYARSTTPQNKIIKDILSHEKVPASVANDFISRSWAYSGNAKERRDRTTPHSIASSHPEASDEVKEAAVRSFLESPEVAFEGVNPPDYSVKANFIHNLIKEHDDRPEPEEGVIDLDKHRIKNTIDTLLQYANHDTDEDYKNTTDYMLRGIAGRDSIDQDDILLVSRILRNPKNKFSRDQISLLYEQVPRSSTALIARLHESPNIDPAILSKDALSRVNVPNDYDIKMSAISQPSLPEETRRQLIQESSVNIDSARSEAILQALSKNPSLSGSEAHEIYSIGDINIKEDILIRHGDPAMFEHFISSDYRNLDNSDKYSFVNDASDKLPSNCLHSMFEMAISDRKSDASFFRKIIESKNVDEKTLRLGASSPFESVRQKALTSKPLWGTLLPEMVINGSVSETGFLDSYLPQKPSGLDMPQQIKDHFVNKYSKPLVDPETGETQKDYSYDVSFNLISSNIINKEIKEAVLNGLEGELKNIKKDVGDLTAGNLKHLFPKGYGDCFTYLVNAHKDLDLSSKFVEKMADIDPKLVLKHVPLSTKVVSSSVIRKLLPELKENIGKYSSDYDLGSLLCNKNMPEEAFIEMLPHYKSTNIRNPLRSRLNDKTDEERVEIINKLLPEKDNHFFILSSGFTPKDLWRDLFNQTEPFIKGSVLESLGAGLFQSQLNDASYEDALLGKWKVPRGHEVRTAALKGKFDITNENHRKALVKFAATDYGTMFNEMFTASKEQKETNTNLDIQVTLPINSISHTDEFTSLVDDVHSVNPSAASSLFHFYLLNRLRAEELIDSKSLGLTRMEPFISNAGNKYGFEFWNRASKYLNLNSSFFRDASLTNSFDGAYDFPNVQSPEMRNSLRRTLADVGLYSEHTMSRYRSDYPTDILVGYAKSPISIKKKMAMKYLQSNYVSSRGLSIIHGELNTEVLVPDEYTEIIPEGGSWSRDIKPEYKDIVSKSVRNVIKNIDKNNSESLPVNVANYMNKMVESNDPANEQIDRFIASEMLDEFKPTYDEIVRKNPELADNFIEFMGDRKLSKFLPRSYFEIAIESAKNNPTRALPLIVNDYCGEFKQEIIGNVFNSPNENAKIIALSYFKERDVGFANFERAADEIDKYMAKTFNKDEMSVDFYNMSERYSDFVKINIAADSPDARELAVNMALKYATDYLGVYSDTDMIERQQENTSEILAYFFTNPNVKLSDQIKMITRLPTDANLIGVNYVSALKLNRHVINNPDVILSATHGWKLDAVMSNPSILDPENVSIITNRAIRRLEEYPVGVEGSFEYEKIQEKTDNYLSILLSTVNVKKDDLLNLVNSVATSKGKSIESASAFLLWNYTKFNGLLEDPSSRLNSSFDNAVFHLVPNALKYVNEKMESSFSNDNYSLGIADISDVPDKSIDAARSTFRSLLAMTNSLGGEVDKKSLAYKEASKLRPHLIKITSSVLDRANSILKENPKAISDQKANDMASFLKTVLPHLSMGYAYSKISNMSPLNNEDAISLMELLPKVDKVMEEIDESGVGSMSVVDTLTSGVVNFVSGWIKNATDINDSHWDGLFNQYPRLILSLNKRNEINKAMVDASFNHIPRLLENSKGTGLTSVLMDGMVDWVQYIKDDQADIIPSFLNRIMTSFQSKRDNFEDNPDKYVESMFGNIANSCIQRFPDKISMEMISRMVDWQNVADKGIQNTYLGQQAFKYGAGGETLRDIFVDGTIESYINEFKGASEGTLVGTTVLSEIMVRPSLGNRNFSKIFNMVKEHANLKTLVSLMEDISLSVENLDDLSVNQMLSTIDSIRESKKGDFNSDFDLKFILNSIAKKSTSIGWNRFKSINEDYMNDQGPLSRYCNSKGSFNPFLLNKKHGVRLFKELASHFSPTPRQNIKEEDLIDFVPDTSSKGWKRLSGVLPKIPAEGITWVNFKKQFPQESNFPEVKQIFMSNPNSPVFPEDISNNLKDYSRGYNISYDIWKGGQRHSDNVPNLVMQFNVDEKFMEKINEDPILAELFTKLIRSGNHIEGNENNSDHPTTPYLIGWSRIDTSGGEKGWVIEEFQSDFGKHLLRILNNNRSEVLNDTVLGGRLQRKETVVKYIKQIQKLIGNWHEVAFDGVVRAAERQGVSKVFIHGADVRSTLSNLNSDQPYPNWLIEMYDRFPRKKGMEEADYFDYPNPESSFAVNVTNHSRRIANREGRMITVPRVLKCWVKHLKKKNT